MMISIVGVLLLAYNIHSAALDMVVQSSGIVCYLVWALALFTMPARRMSGRHKLPWVLDVALIVTALSAAGWFFFIAPKVMLEMGNGFWLTFAYPLANLISIAAVVAAITLGRPFRSARGVLMLGIAINVAGDVLQYQYMIWQKPAPAGYVFTLWIASTLVVGLAALQMNFDPPLPAPSEEDTRRRQTIARAMVPLIFLAALVSLAIWGNVSRPNTYDALGLNFGCVLAIACCLVRIICLVSDNDALNRSLSDVNEKLDEQVQVRTLQLTDALESLELQKQFLRSVIDALPSFVVSKGRDGRVLLANEAAALLYGTDRKGLEGANYAEIVGQKNPGAPKIIGEETNALLTGGLTISTEREIVGADGETRTYEVVKSPVQGLNGVPEQILIVGNDITVRKEAEKTLAAARDAAEETTRVKSEFMAKVSHEMRTPMNGIIGLTELLLAEDLPYAQRELALDIRMSAENLLGMVNDVLDLSKLQSRSADLDLQPACLATMCEDLCTQFRPRAAAKSLSLRGDVRLDPELVFTADASKLRQVLSNLLSNAVKFTEAGVIHLEIDLVEKKRDSAIVRFAVADTGVGIPAEDHARIFEPFVQSDNSATRRYGGTGLGLALCAHLVGALGGRIEVESTPDLGSRFTVTLELRCSNTSASRPELAGMTVLIAEDNAVNQMILKRLLERNGCTVYVTADGCEALQWLHENACDLVLMDCQMPVLDGLEATRRLRRSPAPMRTVPIIAVTANAMEGDREACLAAGMDDYVSKPVKLEALAGAIGRIRQLGCAA
jgi:PAS domain S-box-containing protein